MTADTLQQVPLTVSEETAQLVEAGLRRYVPAYRPRGVVLDHGRGARLWDRNGNEYIDLGTGIGVNSLGHQDPELVEALITQARKLWHTSNIYFTEPTVRLAQELVQAGPFADRVFFCNSGAEANEAAIKLARRHSSLRYPSDKREIITFRGAFHGRTLAAVTATAQPKYHQGFEPLPGGFVYCEFNDFDAVEACFSERTCAVLVEPVQGEGGIRPALPGFLGHLQSLCRRHDALLMLDEVQCGMGRTGHLFAHQCEDEIMPDVVTLAKALGGGVPIGAMLVGPEASQTLSVGSHGSTFGGNPVMAAVARVALRRLGSPGLMANVVRQGEVLRARLGKIDAELDLFSEVRGRGLMIGAELAGKRKGKAGELMDVCRQHGVLILQAGPDVLRFLPPLNINDEELGEGLERLTRGLRSALG